MSNSSFPAQTGPSFAHLIDDTTHFVHEYSSYVRRLSARVRSDRTADKLDEQRSQISSCGHEADDLRLVNYRGLQQVFTKPQVIVLEELHRIVLKLHSYTRELRPILRHDFDDDYIADLVGRLQDTSNGLTHRINSLISAWYLVHQRNTSPLCPAAQALNDGIDEGHVNHISSTHLSHNERSLLNSKGGSFNYWCCPDCHLEKKFYARTPGNNTLETTDESIKFHDAKLSYKVRLLAKSHTRKHASAKYACLICLAQGKEAVGFRNTDALVTHMGSHDIEDLPALFMRRLQLTTKNADGAGDRWDLKFW